ncbi:hypothetical protein BV25DRAFT_1917103 [Artomyces pyxidatus]|uniref:Uncharacterized protein n=1 Tax=Artomyces pyxidatus TaxID=48021 RepID=A0ACB8SYA3_9AGAM|nr:hypothetical protein BV25DRAFT_1917103 [Artomyces pyxidatus]
MPTLQSKSYTFDPRPHFPLLVSVKRYWVPGFESTDPSAPTLVLTHGISFHKEQWEPVLEDLYDIISATPHSIGGKVGIRDAWAIEAPTHGESAVLNEDFLHTQAGLTVSSFTTYKKAIHLVLSGQGKGVDVDFRTRNLVAVGHSMGCIALIMSKTLVPPIPWRSAIFLEPVIIHPTLDLNAVSSFVFAAKKRRVVWPSRDVARKALLKAFKNWDPRVVDVYVKHGLRELPTSEFPDKTEGVTVKCPRAVEIEAYSDHDERLKGPLHLASFCAAIPTHVIFGALEDHVPARNRHFIANEVADGKFKTISVVDAAGHLVSAFSLIFLIIIAKVFIVEPVANFSLPDGKNWEPSIDPQYWGTRGPRDQLQIFMNKS